MMRIGKAHPAEERAIARRAAQPGRRAVGDPVGVVVLARDPVVRDLGSTGVATAGAGEHAAEPSDRARVLAAEPHRVVMSAEWAVGRELDVLEAAPGTAAASREL